MREPRAVIITFIVYEHLRFVFQSSEGRRMQDAVTVSLVNGAVVVFFFGVVATLRVGALDGVRGENSEFFRLPLLARDDHLWLFLPTGLAHRRNQISILVNRR